MALKTDYKDDIFEGRRKYNLITNADGTVSLEDVTDYTVVGDEFSGGDINATNMAIEGMNAVDVSEHFNFELSTATETFKQFYKVGNTVYFSFALSFTQYNTSANVRYYTITDDTLRPKFNNGLIGQNYSGLGMDAYPPAEAYVTISGDGVLARTPNLTASRFVVKVTGSYLI